MAKKLSAAERQAREKELFQEMETALHVWALGWRDAGGPPASSPLTRRLYRATEAYFGWRPLDDGKPNSP